MGPMKRLDMGQEEAMEAEMDEDTKKDLKAKTFGRCAVPHTRVV